MTFQSGATFSGTVTFAPDYSYVETVNGTLYGYQPGVYGYQGSGSDPISWLWNGGINAATPTGGGNIYGTFLMDGSAPSSYENWVDFTYDYTNAPMLVFDNTAGDLQGNTYPPNGVDVITNGDSMVSGSIEITPEPGTLLLLGSGLVGLAGAARRKIGQRN